MEVEDMETQLGIQFPKLSCEVNQSGTNFFSESMGDKNSMETASPSMKYNENLM